MLRRTFGLLLGLAPLVVFGAVETDASQEDELAMSFGDKSIISLITGSAQPIARAPAVASVITAEDIRAMGASDLDQALESVPGLHVSRSSVASRPIYGFRGMQAMDNSQVLMLVNGIPITNLFQGDRGQIWGGMPLENVARIEVIRGPGSALYGADAFAGVINVITKTAADIKGTEFGLRAGSFRNRDTWVQHGGRLGDIDAAFYLRAGVTDGDDGVVRQDAQSALDAAFGTHASLAPRRLQNARRAIDARADLAQGAWRLRAAYQGRELGVGAGVAGSIDPVGRGHTDRLYLDLSYERPGWRPDWDLSGVVGYDNIREYADPAYLLFPPGAFAGAFPAGMIGGPGHSERHFHAGLTGLYTGLGQHRLRVGAGVRVDDLYETRETKNYDALFAPLPGGMVDASARPDLIYLLPHRRNVAHVLIQDEWSLAPDWTLTTGVRHDRYSDFGGTTNPRIALVWDASYNVVVKAMHGRAFRAPSFVELYVINNPVQTGNPDVKPETVATDELALSWQPRPDLQTHLNVFRYHMRDMIRRVGTTTRNAGDQTGRGLELEVTLDATRALRLTGNLSLQHATDEASGGDAGVLPRHRLFARADWRLAPSWQLGATVNRVAARAREPADLRPPIPDYTTLDLVLRRDRFAGGWDGQVAVTNVLDRDAREPTYLPTGMISDLPVPRRAFQIELRHGL